MNAGQTEESEMASCDLPSWWAHPITYLSNSTNCPTPRENVNCGAPVVMTPVGLHQAQPTCHSGRGTLIVCGGARTDGNSMHLLLNLAVKLKLLLKTKLITISIIRWQDWNRWWGLGSAMAQIWYKGEHVLETWLPCLWCCRGKRVMKRSASSVGSFVHELTLGGVSGEA